MRVSTTLGGRVVLASLEAEQEEQYPAHMWDELVAELAGIDGVEVGSDNEFQEVTVISLSAVPREWERIKHRVFSIGREYRDRQAEYWAHAY